MKNLLSLILSILALILPNARAFLSEDNICFRRMPPGPKSSSLQASGNSFEVELAVPPSNSGVTARLKFVSVLSVPSEIIQVRYKLPFGLDVVPKKNLAVCTKDGPGGEKVGDVLRYTSQWSMGLPGGDGLAATAAFTGLGPTWQCSMFDVMKAKNWEQVVAALTSNVVTRTDEVVLVFERPLEPAPEMDT